MSRQARRRPGLRRLTGSFVVTALFVGLALVCVTCGAALAVAALATRGARHAEVPASFVAGPVVPAPPVRSP